MPYSEPENEQRAAYRSTFRKKLVDMFLNEYSVRRDRGELLYGGRWITPEEKFDFMDEVKKDHKHLFNDSLLALVFGIIGALILTFLVKIFFFPR
jgi:hypothetical protein